MRARYLIAAAVLAPSWACSSMQAVSVDFIPQAKPAVIEVKGQYGVRLAVANPRVSGDTLFGTAAGGNSEVALPVCGIDRITTRRFSRGRTALLIGGAAALGAMATFAFIAAGNSRPELACPYENPMSEYEREQCGV